jgi:hypothetical protein
LSYGQHIANAGAKVFEGKPFTWTENSKLEYKLESFGGKRLPNYPFGLNTFSEYHNILCLHAANPTPGYQGFLKWRGRTDDEIWKAIQGESVYQAATRISNRNPKSLERKTIVVASKEAQFLRDLFPINVSNLGDVAEERSCPRPFPDELLQPGRTGRPKVHESNAARQKAFKNQARIIRRDSVTKTPKDRGESVTESQAINFSESWDLIEPSNFWAGNFSLSSLTSARGTLFGKTNSAKTGSYLVSDDSFDFHMTAYLRKFASKTANLLISAAIFNQDSKDEKNILFVQDIYMDFEDGDLRPEHLSEILSGKKYAICNFWNHTKDKPRFRLLVRVDAPMTVDESKAVWDWIAHRIEDTGFSVWSKLNLPAFSVPLS